MLRELRQLRRHVTVARVSEMTRAVWDPRVVAKVADVALRLISNELGPAQVFRVLRDIGDTRCTNRRHRTKPGQLCMARVRSISGVKPYR